MSKHYELDYDTNYIKYEKIKNDIFYKYKIDFDAIKQLCTAVGRYDDTDEKTIVTLFNSCSEALANFKVNYKIFGDQRSITYLDLIYNLPIINFQYLLNNINPTTLNCNFIEIFKLYDLYPSELSSSLKLDIHSDIIDKYAEHLRWYSILDNNAPLSNENIKKYFKYFKHEDNFYNNYDNPHQVFDEEILIFMIIYIINDMCEERSKENSKRSIYFTFCENYKDKFDNLFSSFEFNENQLLKILNAIDKLRTIERQERECFYDYFLRLFVKNQLVTENFVTKIKKRSYNANVDLFPRYVFYSEKYISENYDNPDIICFEKLSENNRLLTGSYSLEFYEKYIDDIIWINFDTKSILDFYEKTLEKFKEFLIKFKNYIPEKSLRDFLRYKNHDHFSLQDLINNFKEIIKGDNSYSYSGYNDEYIIALYELKNINFSLPKYLNDCYSIKTDFVRKYKKYIFNVLLNESGLLNESTIKKLNNILEKIRNEKGEDTNE